MVLRNLPKANRMQRSILPAPVTTAATLAVRQGLTVIAALSLGVLTAYAQEWLPSDLGSLANSSGPWALVTFGLAWLLATNARNGAWIGLLALLSLLLGYVLGAHGRGAASGVSMIAFWSAAALLAGPLVGAGAYWIKSEEGLRPGLAIGAISGVLVGEGVHGLTVISKTTFPPYWLGETIVGVILAAWLLRHSPRSLLTASVAGTIGSLTAGVVFLVYSESVFAALR